jgi:histidine phosphotransferase ChpT
LEILAGRVAAVYHGAPASQALIRAFTSLRPSLLTPSLLTQAFSGASMSLPQARTTGDIGMSGQATVDVTLDALDLAALLCSRVCHDLISPTGAIVNGIEVLEEKDSDEETKTFALDLIKKSAKTASARLQFCRLAFGAAGSSAAQIDLGDAEGMVRGFLDEDKTKLTWQLPRALLPKNRVKLLLNMLIIASQTIPRGGMLTVDPLGEGDSMSFRITAAGLNARIPQAMAGLLEGRSETGTVDAHAIQPFYTGLLAKACGMGVSLAAEGDAIVVTAQ